ncbi:hypothetical protein LF817_19370 [Halobacillus sp. A1]|uniref:hypothetical protein n=1 Tax=Halobacillus sp. A1 TaxID=2880262 RepID=UPI0020A6B226|nr:hypothetical protein [Halobacillus sp. A1]MCP3033488.1 hypothetical protein [Halobacillus sp. A1]
MNKKMITFTSVYALIMAALLVLTFLYDWNPSGYSFEGDGSTVSIKQGVTGEEVGQADLAEDTSGILLFQAAIQDVKAHWQQDLIVISLLFPLILFSLFKEAQPFKEILPHKWFVTMTIAIIVIYAVATLPSYIGEIQSVHDRAEVLLNDGT